MDLKEMIAEFQCPGCVCGNSPSDDCYEEFLDKEDGSGYCKNHVLGTSFGFPGNLKALGMPVGFNKPKMETIRNSRGKTRTELSSAMDIRFYPKGSTTRLFDRLNVPVWAMEHKGCLFIRLYSPRVDGSLILVNFGQTMADVPDTTIDVSEFKDEID